MASLNTSGIRFISNPIIPPAIVAPPTPNAAIHTIFIRQTNQIFLILSYETLYYKCMGILHFIVSPSFVDCKGRFGVSLSLRRIY
jgi:hypothetical protein